MFVTGLITHDSRSLRHNYVVIYFANTKILRLSRFLGPTCTTGRLRFFVLF